MRHKLFVLTVKKLLKSTYIYGSYRTIKTGVSLFWTTRYVQCCVISKNPCLDLIESINHVLFQRETSIANT